MFSYCFFEVESKQCGTRDTVSERYSLSYSVRALSGHSIFLTSDSLP